MDENYQFDKDIKENADQSDPEESAPLTQQIELEGENVFFTERNEPEEEFPPRSEKRTRPLRARRTMAPFKESSPKAENEDMDPYPSDTRGVFEDSLTLPDLSTENPDGSLPEEKTVTEKTNVVSPSITAFDWIKSVLLSFAVVIFIFTVLFRGSTVVGDSMNNTLHSGERIIISNFLYQPKTGDIIVLHTPTYKKGEDFLIKRVIAVGGQTVRINFNTWEVWVNGKLLDESYVLKRSNDTPMNPESFNDPDYTAELLNYKEFDEGFVEFEVEENCVFVMGDNRNNSLDSRHSEVGQINKQYILGRVILRYLPFNVFGPVN